MINRLRENVWMQLFIIYTRYLIGGAFVFASLIKIKGKRFTTESGALEPIDSAWHFFETMYQSGLYWKFIGVGQLIAGFLLMTQRFAKLGAIVNLPIIANVFVITISYAFGLTPVITGGMLLANIALVLWDGNAFRVLINLPPVTVNSRRLEHDMVWEVVGLALFSFTFFYRLLVNKYDMFFWMAICLLIGLVGMVIGIRKKSIYT